MEFNGIRETLMKLNAMRENIYGIELNAMEDRKRLGLPVHHTVVARRRELGFSDHNDL